jgi:hypothetical protein
MMKNTNSRISNTASALAKSIVKTGADTKANEMTNTAQIYITDIKNRIKNKLSSNLRMYIIAMIPVIILLCYLIYKYKINYRTLSALNNMDYKSKIELEKLPQCYELDQTMQYKLCDYYISSSYMTPCIGNQHYDYVSAEMITEVLQSGARYIQIPICEADVGPQALPVIATAEYGQKLITSLNTLEVKSALTVIRGNAFKINKKMLNYPLIIHFILNTNNGNTMNILADNIREILGDLLVDVPTYQKFPIFLEKLCNLLGKVIIFATPEYQGTKLEEFVVPTKNMFENYHYTELGSISIPANSAYTKEYNNKLSTKQQTKNNELFKKKVPSIDYVIKNSDTVGAAILNDNEILFNLTQFNKVGMTMVKPLQYNDVISTNYDQSEAVYFGCQFITMNFQINDDNMKNYLKIFTNSSFIVKPASMRFSDVEEPLPDLLSVYQSIAPKNDNILNEIYYNYNNLLIALEPYSLPNTYLTQTDNNLRFNVGSFVTRDNISNRSYKIGLDQCFIITKSTVGTGGEDIPIFIQAANSLNKLITLNGNYFDIQNRAKNKAELNKQSFYFEKSKSNDNDTTNPMVSLRVIDPNNTMYLAFENKQTKAYANTPQVQAQNNMSFKLHIIPFQLQIKLITLYDGSVKTMSGSILGVLENNTTEGTGYILEPVNKVAGKNFIYHKDQFYLKNPKTNTYVVYDDNTYFLYDKPTSPNSNCVFNFTMSNGFYVLINNIGYNLILFNKNLIKFVKPEEVVSNENLFKIDLKYII